ncbi:Uncharacterised protein [Streptococcus pneumoniae]|nr:Uncharacterised protein [Streptococcus pneumoniae]VLI94487.1 Uncharacterised protein [Streptococcus pneumoniae]
MDNENEISKFFLSSENVKDMKTIANDILNMGLDFKLSEKVSQKKMKEHDDLNFLSFRREYRQSSATFGRIQGKSNSLLYKFFFP